MILQGSHEWFAARCGKVTASAIYKVLAKTKTGWGADRDNYRAQLICERITGNVEAGYSNAAMQWGIDTEGQARAYYAFSNGIDVAETGFVDHPTIAMAGASPDGLIGNDGLIEIKCPSTATHLRTLEGAATDRRYLLQMQWQMACTGRAWCDFASFDPRLPEPMQLHVQRVARDDALIAEIETEVSAFLAEIDEAVARLAATYLETA